MVLLLWEVLLELLLDSILKPVIERGRHRLVGIRRADLGSCGNECIINVVLTSDGTVVNLLTLADGSLYPQLLLQVVELLLLLVKSYLLLGKLGTLGAAEVKLLKLLSGGLNVSKLLLKFLLLLSKVHVCSNELSVEIGIHMLLGLFINGKLRWRKDLIDSVLLATHHVLVNTLLVAVLGKRRLGSGIIDVVLAITVKIGSHAASSVVLSTI